MADRSRRGGYGPRDRNHDRREDRNFDRRDNRDRGDRGRRHRSRSASPRGPDRRDRDRRSRSRDRWDKRDQDRYRERDSHDRDKVVPRDRETRDHRERDRGRDQDRRQREDREDLRSRQSNREDEKLGRSGRTTLVRDSPEQLEGRSEHNSPLPSRPKNDRDRNTPLSFRVGKGESESDRLSKDRAEQASGDAQLEESMDHDGDVNDDYQDEEEDDIEVEDDGMAAMQAMMGFGGFGSTKGTKVAGNNAGAVRKEKKSEYRQYMNRVGGFNRPLSPTRQ